MRLSEDHDEEYQRISCEVLNSALRSIILVLITKLAKQCERKEVEKNFLKVPNWGSFFR